MSLLDLSIIRKQVTHDQNKTQVMHNLCANYQHFQHVLHSNYIGKASYLCHPLHNGVNNIDVIYISVIFPHILFILNKLNIKYLIITIHVILYSSHWVVKWSYISVTECSIYIIFQTLSPLDIRFQALRNKWH